MNLPLPAAKSHQNLGKTRSADFLSRSLGITNFKKRWEELKQINPYKQNAKTSPTLQVPNTLPFSSTSNQTPGDTKISQLTLTIPSNINMKIPVSKQITEPIYMPNANTQLQNSNIELERKNSSLKASNIMEEGTDFGSVTSSEKADYSDQIEDKYLSQADKESNATDIDADIDINSSIKKDNLLPEIVNVKENLSPKPKIKLQKFLSTPAKKITQLDVLHAIEIFKTI